MNHHRAQRESRGVRTSQGRRSEGAGEASLQASGAGVAPLQRSAGNRAVGRMLAGGVQRRAGGASAYDAPPDVIHEAARQGVSTASSALPYAAEIQRAFGGHDIRGVRAHHGPSAAAASAAMGASAYTTGEHVVFAGTPDLRTVAHEAAHVVQQRAGIDLPDGVGREGDAYERHADEVAERVVQGRSAEALLSGSSGSEGAAQVPSVQRMKSRVLGMMAQFGSRSTGLEPGGRRWISTVMKPTRFNEKGSVIDAGHIQLQLSQNDLDRAACFGIDFPSTIGLSPAPGSKAIRTRDVEFIDSDGEKKSVGEFLKPAGHIAEDSPTVGGAIIDHGDLTDDQNLQLKFI